LGTSLHRSTSTLANEDEKVRENEGEKKQGDRNVVRGTAYVIAMEETKKKKLYCLEGFRVVPTRPSGKGKLEIN